MATRLSQAALERAHAERQKLLHECYSLLEQLAYRPYYLKLLYGVRYMLQGMLMYKNPGAPKPVQPPTLTAVEFEKLSQHKTA